MNLQDTTLLRAWIKQVAFGDLSLKLPEGETSNKRIRKLRKALVSKARFYKKHEWVDIWSASEPFPIQKWQTKAINSLETLNKLPDPTPLPIHEIGQWFKPETCKVIPKDNATLGDLIEYLNKYFNGSEAINPAFKKNLKLFLAFCDTHSKSLGSVIRKPEKSDNQLFLLEEISLLQRAVDTKEEFNEEAIIQANNDYEAIAVWLTTKKKKNTRPSYSKEAKRLIIWLYENNLTLAELKVEHVHQYYAHLANPPAHWIRPRKINHGDILETTQLLFGAQSNQSIDYTRTVLSQLCTFLQQAGYLRRNPFRLTARPVVVSETVVTRYLDLNSWQWLWQWILTLPRETKYEKELATRTRWVFALLYHTGIRREQAAEGKMGDFVKRDQLWLLRTIGKGNKKNYLTVNSVLLKELVIYRNALGLPDYPLPGDEYPLITSVYKARRDKPVQPRAISWIVQTTGELAVAMCEDPHIKEQLNNMTTHWMRHTNATHRLMAGASLETTQDELGHADPRTTRIYAKTTNLKRREDAEKLANLSG